MVWRILFLFMFYQALADADDIDQLIQQGKMHYQQGQYRLATTDTLSAKKLIATPNHKAQVDGLLGLIYSKTSDCTETPDQYLSNANDSKLGSLQDRVQWMIALAELNADRNNTEAAEDLYAKALNLAKEDKVLKVNALLSRANIIPFDKKLDELLKIRSMLNVEMTTDLRAQYLIELGLVAKQIPSEDGLKLAYESFEQAKQISEGKPQLLAESLNELAQLYEDKVRDDEAKNLNHQALRLLQNLDNINAHGLLFQLNARQGRLLVRQNAEEALIAYQNAVDHLEAIRQDIPIRQDGDRSYFQNNLIPFYINLADLLLKHAQGLNGERKTEILRRARDTVELIKQAELESYLGNRCGYSTKNKLEKISSDTAVIYPVLLADRMELLVSIGDEIKQFTQFKGSSEIQRLAENLKDEIHKKNNAKHQGQLLYDQFIAPMRSWLDSHEIKTIVMVPSSELQSIPLAAFHDGKQYLIENYAIAISPGLTLLKPAEFQQQRFEIFLAGVSKASSGFNELKGVELEIKRLGEKYATPIMLNEDFKEEKFKRQIEMKPYTVVHLATHGQFANTAKESFIKTGDGSINFNELEGFLTARSKKFTEQPIELLTLSACQTAEGNDLAFLGLSGIAIKSKVRSALGSLWLVSDKSAYPLIILFYDGLLQSNNNKAQALQKAQIAVLKREGYENPYYWSSFVLVGNWL